MFDREQLCNNIMVPALTASPTGKMAELDGVNFIPGLMGA